MPDQLRSGVAGRADDGDTIHVTGSSPGVARAGPQRAAAPAGAGAPRARQQAAGERRAPARASAAATKTVSSPAIEPTTPGRPASSSDGATGCASAGGVFRTTSDPAPERRGPTPRGSARASAAVPSDGRRLRRPGRRRSPRGLHEPQLPRCRARASAGSPRIPRPSRSRWSSSCDRTGASCTRRTMASRRRRRADVARISIHWAEIIIQYIRPCQGRPGGSGAGGRGPRGASPARAARAARPATAPVRASVLGPIEQATPGAVAAPTYVSRRDGDILLAF